MTGWLSKSQAAATQAQAFALLMVRPQALHTQLIYLKRVLWQLQVQQLLLQVLVMAEHTPFL